jgi:hypothetical protein
MNNNKGIMLKTYEDERINKELKKCLIRAVKDDEFDLRYDENYGMEDFNILLNNIDKMLKYVNCGYKGELRLNSNIWYVCLDTLDNILALYDLKFIRERKVSENELVVPIKEVGKVKEKVFNKMIQYGWNLGFNKMEDFNNVYNIHKDFLDSCYKFKCLVAENNKILNMNDISVSSFEDMLDFMTDFLRAFEEVDKEMK